MASGVLRELGNMARGLRYAKEVVKDHRCPGGCCSGVDVQRAKLWLESLDRKDAGLVDDAKSNAVGGFFPLR